MNNFELQLAEYRESGFESCELFPRIRQLNYELLNVYQPISFLIWVEIKDRPIYFTRNIKIRKIYKYESYIHERRH